MGVRRPSLRRNSPHCLTAPLAERTLNDSEVSISTMPPPTNGTSWSPPLGALPQYVATVSRTGEVLFVNKLGGPFGRHPTVGTTLADSAGPELWQSIASLVERAFEQREPTVVEVSVACEDTWFECHVGPDIRDDVVVAATIVAIDVTRRRRSEVALRLSEERVRAVLRATPDMFFRMDGTGVFRDFHGGDDTFVPPEEFLGRSIEDVLPSPVGVRLREAVEIVAVTKEPMTVDYLLADPRDGRSRYFEGRLFYDISGDVFAVVRDVTDHERAKTALANSEKSFRTVIEQMPDSVIIHRAGSIIYVNPACKSLLGYGLDDDFVGRDMFEMIHADDHDRVDERIAALRRTGEPAPVTELRLLRADGEIVYVELAPVQLLQLADGAGAHLVVARDLTQRRRMQERFLLADRVASMGTLAAGVAHEINNPLTYVVGNLSVAAKGLALLTPRDEDRPRLRDLEKSIADARAGAERVRYIVGDLKAFSRPDRGELTNLDPRRVLDSAINMAWSEIRHRARLLREYAITPTVHASETRLGQVFLNLLVNATQAIEEAGATQNTIRVVAGTAPDGRALIEIWDSGIGIAQMHRDRIWEPFFTTKTGEGTGLGLSICQSIVTSFGGEIEADRDEAKGTVFRVLLPAVAGHPDLPRPPQLQLESAENVFGRILVVDDEPVVATLVRRALEGHDVYILTSARDAIDMCRQLDFDVIVCDLLMPDLTGMDLFEQLRAISPDFEERIVFMTAGAFTARARRFIARVSNPVVEKPFELDDLARTVQGVLQRVRASAARTDGRAIGEDVAGPD